MTRTLERASRTEQAVVGTRHKAAEADSRLDCAVEAGDGLDCNTLLMTSCLFLAVPALYGFELSQLNVRGGRWII